MTRRAIAIALAAALAASALVAHAARAATTTLVPQGAAWRYHALGQDLGGTWRAPLYGDAAWPSGPAKLGFGDPDIATTVPGGPTNARFPTIYFRTSFVAPDPDSFTSLVLRADYDDGFVAYLNGVEIARRGLGSATVSYSSLAANHEAGAFETIDVTAALPSLVAGTNVLAVEVHQQSATSSDLAWNADLRATASATGVVRGPYLQNGAPTAVTVRWRTDAPTDSRVRWGPAPGLFVSSVSDAALTTEHELRITGLLPGVRAYYAVGTSAGDLTGGDATTWYDPPPEGGSTPSLPRRMRAWILGDSGRANVAQSSVRDAYLDFTGTTKTDVWLMLGDNAYDVGTDAEFQDAVFDPFAEFLRCHVLWPTRGNHDDLHSGAANDYYELFTMPTSGEAGGMPSGSEAWYSFDYADVHFVCLDSEGSNRTPGGPMLTWLAADLAATDQKWIVAFWHHPPYSKGSHDSDAEAPLREMRENALPILEAHGVDLVLAGHSHSYERSFLLDGHYGLSNTLQPWMIRDGGDGRPDGDGAYQKPVGNAPHAGAVYTVAGSSSSLASASLDHPVMVTSLLELGSLVLDVAGDTLELRFLDDEGAVRDSFRIVKPEVIDSGGVPGATSFALRAIGANPSYASFRVALELPGAARARVDVLDARGRRVRLVSDAELPAGRSDLVWDGNDDAGRRTAPGVYFVRAVVDGERRVVRLVRSGGPPGASTSP